jgi:hypothetical protein
VFRGPQNYYHVSRSNVHNVQHFLKSPFSCCYEKRDILQMQVPGRWWRRHCGPESRSRRKYNQSILSFFEFLPASSKGLVFAFDLLCTMRRSQQKLRHFQEKQRLILSKHPDRKVDFYLVTS